MKSNIQNKLYRTASCFEIFIGICILIAIASSTVGLLVDLDFISMLKKPETIQSYLTTAMTIIIGVELVKMIFSYTIDTVIEVMMLTVARQMIVTHTSPVENLITILSVALLFVVRKFLFVRQLDQVPHSSHRRNQSDLVDSVDNLSEPSQQRKEAFSTDVTK